MNSQVSSGNAPRIHILQHVPFEGPGYIEEWMVQKKLPFTVTEWFSPQPQLPETQHIDSVIVMGGPMGVHDEQLYPWLKNEKEFIRAAIRSGKKVLGICLGAQLIAAVLGARIYPNEEREIGWFPLVAIPHASTPPWLQEAIDQAPTVFHWHGDTFDLPAGVINHASSAACVHQLFTWQENVMGIQFHYEITEFTWPQIMPVLRKDLSTAAPTDRYMQEEQEILQGQSHMAACHSSMQLLLDHFLLSGS